MAYTEQYIVEEFPYKGTFYEVVSDATKPLSEQKSERINILSVTCDIQEAHSSQVQGFTQASYQIFFKYDTSVDFPLKRGYFFEGDISGMEILGEIIGVYPSKRFGKCGVYIKDVNS